MALLSQRESPSPPPVSPVGGAPLPGDRLILPMGVGSRFFVVFFFPPIEPETNWEKPSVLGPLCSEIQIHQNRPCSLAGLVSQAGPGFQLAQELPRVHSSPLNTGEYELDHSVVRTI